MDVMYCGDRNIADGVLISVMSLLRHVREPLNIHLVTAGIEAPRRSYLPLESAFAERLDAFIRASAPGGSVVLHDVSRAFAAEPPRANMSTRFTPLCTLRLYTDDLAELPERILYLDNDVVCRRDPAELWATDLAGAEFAGVLDHYGRRFFRRRWPHQDYVNSGVLLLDMARVRETGLFRRCRELVGRRRILMPDQSALNRLACDKVLLPRRFNDQHGLQPDTVLQHFTTFFRFVPFFHTVTVKPWQVDRMHDVLGLHAYDDLLEEYLRLRGAFMGDAGR